MNMSAGTAHLGFVSHRFTRNDGQGRVNYEIVRAALDQGYHVTLLAEACAEDLAAHPHLRFLKFGRTSLPTELLRTLAFARETARWLRKNRQSLDLIQVNGFVTWEPGDVAAAHFVHAAWYHHPFFPFRTLTPYNLYQRLYTFLNIGWERRAFGSAKRVIAVSNVVEAELIRSGVDAGKVAVIPNGIDPEQFCPGPSERGRFGLPESVTLALFVGDIRTPRKNLETVLSALLRTPDLHLAVAGRLDGNPYEAMARSLGLTDRVIFLGKITEMEVLMRSVDFFVFPSRYEPFGLVVLEAMASGTPVIVSRSSGAADFIGGGGLVLDDPNDVSTLASLMRMLTEDAGKRSAMGIAGRQIAVGMQWKAMTDAYLRMYAELLADKQQ